MRATIRTGMRPSEWATSEIRIVRDQDAPHGRQIWLFVCNAKVSNGRANGPIRAIDLTEIEDRFIEPIWRTIEVARFNTEMEGLGVWLARMRRVLNQLDKIGLVQNRYTPYSARHQAIANWKSVYTPVEVAALAGHAVPKTATTHYGKMKDAWPSVRLGTLLVRASPVDVARIEARVALGREAQKMRDTRASMDLIANMEI